MRKALKVIRIIILSIIACVIVLHVLAWALLKTLVICYDSKFNKISDNELAFCNIKNTPKSCNEMELLSCTNGTDYFYIDREDNSIIKLGDDSFKITYDEKISNLVATEHFLYYFSMTDQYTQLNVIAIDSGEKTVYDFSVLNQKTPKLLYQDHQFIIYLYESDNLYTLPEVFTDQSDMFLLNSILSDNVNQINEYLYVASYKDWLIWEEYDGKIGLITDKEKTKIIFHEPNSFYNVVVAHSNMYQVDYKDYNSLLDDTKHSIDYGFEIKDNCGVAYSDNLAYSVDDKIIWNTNIGIHMRNGGYANGSQDSVKFDLLLEFQADTMDNRVIYKTVDYKTKIVGYLDGSVILYDTVKQQFIKHKIVSDGSDARNTDEADVLLATLDHPGIKSLTMEWCNNVLFVYDDSAGMNYKFMTAIKVS